MKNFEYYAPTRVVFGRGTENETGALIRKDGGTRVLIVYGGGSCVQSGLLARVEESLTGAGLAWEAFGGAQPNPLLSHAEEGVQKALSFGADYILAIGGGSAIDTAKAIAHGTANPDNALWDIWTGVCPLKKSLPHGCVLTIAAAGSEMSSSAVLTNADIHVKKGIDTDFNRCRFAVMNPELLATVPRYQLAAGIADIMQHTMERYFIPDSHAEMTDEIAEGLLRTVIRNGRLVLADPTNYDAMAEVMWCSSLSHNWITGLGRDKDFSVHKFGHSLSAFYGATHGASLTAVWKAWAEYLYMDAIPRFAQFARRVWEVTEVDDELAAREGIRQTVNYFREIGMPVSLRELGIDPSEEELDALAANCTQDGKVTLTKIRPVGLAEAREIFRAALTTLAE